MLVLKITFLHKRLQIKLFRTMLQLKLLEVLQIFMTSTHHSSIHQIIVVKLSIQFQW